MEREFTVATGWKIFYGLIAVFMAGFGFLLFSIPHSNSGGAVVIMPILVLGFAVLLGISQFRRRVTISADRVVQVNAFNTKELTTADIKGCRISDKVIHLEPISPSNPRITISNYSDFTDSADLVKWIKDNFTDLDVIALKAEQDKLLDDPALGFTVRDREDKLTRARRVGWSYNIAGLIIGFSMIFCKNDFVFSFTTILFPLAGVAIMIFSNGLMKFVSNSKRSAYSFIMLGFIMPAFIMLIRSLFDFEISDYQNIWLPFVGISSITALLLYTIGINKAAGPVLGQAVFMLIAGFIYGYGSTIQINCVFDKSAAKLIHTSVYNKWIEHNKGSHYI